MRHLKFWNAVAELAADDAMKLLQFLLLERNASWITDADVQMVANQTDSITSGKRSYFEPWRDSAEAVSIILHQIKSYEVPFKMARQSIQKVVLARLLP